MKKLGGGGGGKRSMVIVRIDACFTRFTEVDRRCQITFHRRSPKESTSAISVAGPSKSHRSGRGKWEQRKDNFAS